MSRFSRTSVRNELSPTSTVVAIPCCIETFLHWNKPGGTDTVSLPTVSTFMLTRSPIGLRLVSDPVGRFIDWHPAPRRQFVIILSGQLEIGLGDGSKHIFGAGDARLVEDTTGEGHTTRVHGNQPCLTATIPLQQQ